MPPTIEILLQGKSSGAVTTLNDFAYWTQDKIGNILPEIKKIIFPCGSGAENYQSFVFQVATGKASKPVENTIESDSSVSALKAWEEFRKYKGIISCVIDVKAELAKARDEKYAYFD